MVDRVNPKITVAPLVPMCVLDHHTRRDFFKEVKQEGKVTDANQVFGALMGAVVDGTIEIRSSLPVKCDVKKGTSLDLLFQKEMLLLNQKIYPNERIVGWYATQYSPAFFRGIHEHYRRQIKNCPAVCFVMDPHMKNGTLNPKCFIMTSCKIGGEEIPDLCKEIPFTWKCRSGTEKIAMETMISNRHKVLAPLLEGLPDQIPTDELQSCAKRASAARSGYTSSSTRDGDRAPFEQVHKHLLQIQSVLKKSLDYVNSVIEGNFEQSNAEIGRLLLNLVQSIPPVDAAAFDQLFNSTTQDMLMLNYLAKLTQTQVQLMERLHVYVPENVKKDEKKESK